MMNIVVSINANYIPPLCVMLRSLLDSNPGRKVDLYLIHSSLTGADVALVTRRVPDSRLRVTPVPVPADFLDDAPVLFHFPKEMYYRIFSARLLPQSLDRALYLDPDMVVNLPLDGLYDLAMGSSFFAAARAFNPLTQVEYRHRLGMPEGSEYFNSGVLLMNLAQLRREQDPGAVLDFIREERDKLVLPDQDVLNALYWDRTILLDPMVYKYDARYYGTVKVGTLGKLDLEWIRENSVIIHYCGKNKPWQEKYRSEIGVFYQEAAARLES